jgi:hypothetical protein
MCNETRPAVLGGEVALVVALVVLLGAGCRQWVSRARASSNVRWYYCTCCGEDMRRRATLVVVMVMMVWWCGG